MRLLELRSNGVGSPTLEFHPNLTIVYGLSTAGREQVIRAVEALPAGIDSGMGGLLEAHGVLFDLTPTSLEVLGMIEPAEVVVRPDDVPDDEDTQMASVTPLFGEPAGDGASVSSDAEIAEAEARVEQARTARDDAAEACAVMADALSRAKLERAAAVEASQRIQLALDKARRERDIARAQRDGRVDESLAGGREQQLQRRLEELGRLELEIAEGLGDLEQRDPRPIQVLVDALHQPVSDRLVPSAEAAALADEFAELQQQLDELERRLQADGLSMDQVSQRLEDARYELSQAERGVSKPELTSEDVRELEALHEQVLDAERRASGRVGRKAALAKLDELRQEEQVILDRVGFPTWTSYVMGAALLNIDPVAEQRVERARADLDEAEAAWAYLTSQLEAEPEYASLLDRLESVFLTAFDLLGGDTEGDLEDRLRHHLVPDQEVSRGDIIEALGYQLSLREIEVEEGLSPEAVETLAEQWLAETEGHWDRYRALQDQQIEVVDEKALVEREIESLGGDPDLDTPEERQSRYESAEAHVAEILSDLEGVSEIVADLDGQVEAREMMLTPMELSLQMAEAGCAAAEQQLAELSGAGGVPPIGPSYDRNPEIYDDLPYADDDDDEAAGLAEGSAESYLLLRLAALRNRSHGGSVPLVIDDALAGRPTERVIEVLNGLERLSESVQVIYLTDDDEIIGWADEVGLQRAAAVQPDGPFGES
jgi:hypothetical protein